MKKYIIGFILGAIVFAGIGVYAAIKIQADEIGYKEGTVEDALNDLYSKTNNSKKTCLYVSGTKGAVNTKYLCDPGDGIARYFYILKTENNNIKLIMERNITDTVGSNVTMTWNDAMSFLENNNINTLWKNVSSVDLPSAQEIADAGGITGFNLSTINSDYISYFGVNNYDDKSKRAAYAWLYNYTRGCVSIGNCSNECPDTNEFAYGYWTKDLVPNNNEYALQVARSGVLARRIASDNENDGVRPVITISTNQLSN